MVMDLETQKGKEDSADSVESVGGVQSSTSTEIEIEIEIEEDGNRSSGSAVAEKPGEEREEAKAPPEEAEKKDAKAAEEEEAEKEDCVIEVKRGGGSPGAGGGLRSDKVCRICHLGSENSELIRLGCGCKEELGVSHLRCAETWFMQKGNRECEICGKTARNITGIEDSRIVMLEWNEMRLMHRATNASGREGSCRCRNSLCNLLLAGLVLLFILPWFFRVDMG